MSKARYVAKSARELPTQEVEADVVDGRYTGLYVGRGNDEVVREGKER